jgi:hypothetical protein
VNAYDVVSLDGARLGSHPALETATAWLRAHPARACVVHGGRVVAWADGLDPHDRGFALAYLRRVGVLPPVAGARTCATCPAPLPAKAQADTCYACRDRAKRGATRPAARNALVAPPAPAPAPAPAPPPKPAPVRAKAAPRVAAAKAAAAPKRKRPAPKPARRPAAPRCPAPLLERATLETLDAMLAPYREAHELCEVVGWDIVRALAKRVRGGR